MNNETSCNMLAHRGRPSSQVLRPSSREPTDTAKWDAWDGDPDQRPRIGRTRAGEGPVNGRGRNACPCTRGVHYPDSVSRGWAFRWATAVGFDNDDEGIIHRLKVRAKEQKVIAKRVMANIDFFSPFNGQYRRNLRHFANISVLISSKGSIPWYFLATVVARITLFSVMTMSTSGGPPLVRSSPTGGSSGCTSRRDTEGQRTSVDSQLHFG